MGIVGRIVRQFDRLEIEDVLARYCRGIDRFDEALMLSAFHPDAIEKHGGWSEGNAADVTRALLVASSEFSSAHIHVLGNVNVTFESRARAHSEAYMLAVSRRQLATGPADFTFLGRLLDTFEKRKGEWRIVERLLVKDITRLDRVTDDTKDPDPGSIVVGSRDRSDPSYRQKAT